MSVIGLIITLLILGIVLYFLRPYLPDVIFKIILVVIAFGCVLWLLDKTGVWPNNFKLT